MAESVSKRQKPSDDRGVSDDDNDRFSDLPDQLLSHILSFLPTKQAVATSVLSKRWRPQWLYTQSFDFEEQHFTTKGSFRYFADHFANAFLASRREPIKRFRLDCVVSNYKKSEHYVNEWINAGIGRGIERFEIERLPINFLLSSEIFACRSLVVLKLSCVKLKAISSLTSLPSLKILQLRDVLFSCAASIHNLLSAGRSLLEDLVASNIGCSDFFPIPLIEDFPNLISAHFQNCWYSELLPALSNVKYLRYDEITGYHPPGELDCTPVFRNLVHMKLYFGYYHWKFVATILQNSPTLEILEIFIRLREYRRSVGDRNKHFVAPRSLSPHLRKCYVEGFEVKECECMLRFARYIMQNAGDLHTFTIRTRPTLTSEAKLEMLTKLSSFPSLSPTCQLCFG